MADHPFCTSIDSFLALKLAPEPVSLRFVLLSLSLARPC